MNSKQVNDAFDLALRRALANGLTDLDAIAVAMMDDPAMAPVITDPVVSSLVFRQYLRRMAEEVVAELAAAEGWELK